MILAIDIGNTNVKCKIWNDADVLFVKSYSISEIDFMLSELREYSLDKVTVACVGPAAVEDIIRKEFSSLNYWHLKSDSFCLEVSNGYEDPVTLGIDRLLAITEAFYDSEKKACCVFDLGTALTLDVIDDNGNHIGGYIVPGLALMREALMKGTQQIKYESKDSGRMDYATNTADAVERGTLSVICAWIKSEAERFKNIYPEGSVYLTGGGAQYILPLLDCDLNYRKDLVIDALKRIASN